MAFGALLLVLAQVAPLPFQMELPPGYGPFQLEEGSAHAWAAEQIQGTGRFGLARMEVQASGADPERIASGLRKRRWDPLLAEVVHKIDPWQGIWVGRRSAGNFITFQDAQGTRAVLERVAVGGNHLLLGTWEGRIEEAKMAGQSLATLTLPQDWWPDEGPTQDLQSGLGQGDGPRMGFGHYELFLKLLAHPWSLEVQIQFQPGPLFDSPDLLAFRLPQGPDQEVSPVAGVFSLSYTLDLEQARGVGQNSGLSVSGRSVVASHPSWLAIPLPPDAGGGPLAAPSWTLALSTPAFDACLSATLPIQDDLDRELGVRVRQFPRVRAGEAWPFFAAGPMVRTEVIGHAVWLPPGAAATHREPVIQALDQFAMTTAELWADPGPWTLHALPGCGDRILPGLFLLDQNHRWLQSPLDAPWGGSHRLVGLAKFSSARLFGLRLRGLGTARGFLEAALAEWAACRLLDANQNSALATALQHRWQEHDLASGPLPSPLSLMPISDLQGDQRLLSRGALVWQALAQTVGQEHLDTTLRHFLHGNGFWSTEDLRLHLQKRTGMDLEPFFRNHVYGIAPPSNIPSK